MVLMSLAPVALLAQPNLDELIHKMTLEEKIGQLTQIGGVPFMPDSLTPEDRIRKGQAGSILWLSDPVAINRMQKIAVEGSRLHIPLIFGLDVIHGFRTIFPMPLAMAASWDMPMIERVQSIAAREARAAGIAWTFAPMVDIARDPRWGRIVEGAGEDPYLGAAVARAQVRGFQGKDMSAPDRLLACAKHFAGYGAAEGGRDYDSTYLSDEQLWNVYLPPFRAALDAGVGTFMSAYMDLNGVPATANRFLLQDVLRTAWGFKGFVVSDANSVKDLETHGFARDAKDAAYRGFSAGVDMDMASRTYLSNLGSLVEAGKVPVASIDRAVRSILEAKVKLGLFERPYVEETLLGKVLAMPDRKEMARTAAERSAVLLRNEGVLPLAESVKSIAVIGPLGDSRRDMLSMWAGFSVDLKNTGTILQGIQSRFKNAKVGYAPGVQVLKPIRSMFEDMLGSKAPDAWSAEQTRKEFAAAVELAKRSDVVVMTLGELAFMSGELASQSSLELPGRQQELLEAVAATGKPVVLVMVSGRPLNIVWASTHVGAILQVWHAGDEGGAGVARLLAGDVTPVGKLPVSWPRDAGQIPVYYAHNRTHQPETAEGFKSRYWDQASAPLYPFGYGLSYTRFAYSNLKVSAGSQVLVSVDVENTGKRAGEETAQLYVHQRAGLASRPVRELKGFEKLSLKPGEKRTVQFTLGKDELRYWSAQEKTWVVEAETFDVWAGGDSTAQLHATFEPRQLAGLK